MRSLRPGGATTSAALCAAEAKASIVRQVEGSSEVI